MSSAMFRHGRNHWRQVAKLAVAGTVPSSASANLAVRQFASEAGGSKGGKGFVSLSAPTSYLECTSIKGKVTSQDQFLTVACLFRERSSLSEAASELYMQPDVWATLITCWERLLRAPR